MSRLWDWALDAYARPGVASACLQLQDETGQSVPLLLWALWSHAQGRTPDLLTGAHTARSWEDEAVGPLRRLRRALKALGALGAEPDREAVRDQVKAVELDAERRLLGALERLHPLPGPPPEAAAELLSRAAAAYDRPVPPDAFDPLLRALNPGSS